MCGVRWGSKCIFLHVDVVPSPFVERLLFPQFYCLGTLVENGTLAYKHEGLFLTLSSIALIYMFVLMPIPHCFDRYSFVVTF